MYNSYDDGAKYFRKGEGQKYTQYKTIIKVSGKARFLWGGLLSCGPANTYLHCLIKCYLKVQNIQLT